MRILIYIILFVVVFSCKKTEHNIAVPAVKSTVDNSQFIDSFEENFLGSVNFLKLEKPYLITSRRFNTFNILSEDQNTVFETRKLFNNQDTITKFGIALDIGFSKHFKSFVVYKFIEDQVMHYKLANYTNNYQFIDAIDVSYYDLTHKMNETETYVYENKLFVHNIETKKTKAYRLNLNGTFEKQTDSIKFNFLDLKKFDSLESYLDHHEQRVVKVNKGLPIKDSIGKSIGEFDFLETVSVIEYLDKALKTINNGQQVNARQAQVIVNPKALKKEQNFYIDNFNVGYVSEDDLFDVYQDNNTHYRYDGLSITNNPIQKIDLKQWFDIAQIDLTTYKKQILKTPVITDVTKQYKTDKVVTLFADNGKKVIYKDTTYNSEFNPTKTYSVTLDDNFKDEFVVHSQMVFDYQRFDFISKSDGTLLDQYVGGYPHVSPNKDVVVSVDYDAECPNQRTLFIDTIKDNKIIKCFELYYNLEEDYSHITFGKTSETTEVYWLSNTEFIVKFWAATECYSDSDQSFYYKYKIKQSFLQLLDAI